MIGVRANWPKPVIGASSRKTEAMPNRYKQKFTPEQIASIRAMYAAGQRPSNLARKFQISKTYLYQLVRDVARPPRTEAASSNHRLSLIRRIIELPLLLQEGWIEQEELREMYEVDAVTIRRDIKALSDYWPIERGFKGRKIRYRLKKGARPELGRAGKRK